MNEFKYNIGYALSGGFIKGFAHLGIMQALHEHGIRPEILSGVSAGALAAVFYADGKEPYHIVELFEHHSFKELTTFSINKQGLLKLDSFIDFLNSNLESKTIEELKIPTIITATDLDHGRIVSFKKGKIAERLAASCCMPILFAPIRINNTYYVDGGILMNLPVSPIRKECEKVIALNVDPLVADEYSKNVVSIALRAYHFIFQANTLPQKGIADLLIESYGLEEYSNRELAECTTKALNEIRTLGATHIWYTGIIEHATQTNYTRYGIKPDHPAVVKGKAGSPYAIKDYYDVDPDLATSIPDRMKEFENLVTRSHKAGLKVIIDFVPNHVARQYGSDAKPEGVTDLGEKDDVTKAFSPNNNFYYIPDTKLEGNIDLHRGAAEPYIEFPAKATGNDRFDAWPNSNDWYETVKLNYGIDYLNGHSRHFEPIPDTWVKMRDILLFWSAKGIDGFRCDMAEMVPVEFWGWVIPQIKAEHPKLIFIAEVYNPGEYRNYLFNGKFDYLYDKVGLYDTLRAITCGWESATAIPQRWQSLGGIEKRMLNFLENHDEQRIASDYFAGNGSKAIPAMIVSACMNTNPVMIYFGQALGEHGMDTEGFSGRDGRTTIFDYWSVDSIRRWRNGGKFDNKFLNEDEKQLKQFYTRLLNICNSEKAIREGVFFDLTYANLAGWVFNEHKQYAFLRKQDDELILIMVNFDSIPARSAVNIPQHAFDYLGIHRYGEYEATELLTGNTEKLTLMPDKTTPVLLDGMNGKILKFKL